MSIPEEKRFWLIKFAPFRTPWAEIVKRGSFTLRGVRSPAARSNLSKMRLGDKVLYYHSQKELAVVGVMEVAREAYPDPTCTDAQWLTCDFVPMETLEHPVPLGSIKADQRLLTLAVVRQPRLSVMPVTEEQFHIIAGGIKKLERIRMVKGKKAGKENLYLNVELYNLMEK